MIKTKTPQIIDAQNGLSTDVYFSVTSERKLFGNNTIEFTILSSIVVTDQEGKTSLRGIKENRAVFKLTTFNNLFGDMTALEFQNQLDTIMIQQIEYINNHTWTGNEPMEKNSYWDLTSEDLEIFEL
jgi:hypothetical protein